MLSADYFAIDTSSSAFLAGIVSSSFQSRSGSVADLTKRAQPLQMAVTIYPHVQKALHAELDAVVGTDRLPSKRSIKHGAFRLC